MGRHTDLDMIGRPSHSATKVFQALRIFVNDELNELNLAIRIAGKLLKKPQASLPQGSLPQGSLPRGCLAVLTFHSLEDRIVKRNFRGIAMDEEFNLSVKSQRFKNAKIFADKKEIDRLTERKWLEINRNIQTPTQKEIAANPRSRSARLRAAFAI